MVQRLGQPEWIPVFFHVAMGDLSQPMDTCIGAACGGDGVIARFKLGQRSLDCALH